jgi:hypothetical protein
MKKQHKILIGVAGAYALLLCWSLNYNKINIKPGHMPSYIGHNLQDHGKTTQILPHSPTISDTLSHHGLLGARRWKDTIKPAEQRKRH